MIDIQLHDGQRPDGDEIRRRAVSAGGLPVVAVMPLWVVGDSERERWLADSIAQDLAIHLCRVGWVRVIDYLATRSRPVSASNPLDAAVRLGADFAITGSIRKVGNETLVKLQVLCIPAGAIVWADRFKLGPEAESISDQDDIVSGVCGRVADFIAVLGQTLGPKAIGKPWQQTSILASVSRFYDYLHRFDDESFRAALAAVEQAVRRDPQFGWGWGALSFLHVVQYGHVNRAQTHDPEEVVGPMLKRALAIDPSNPFAEWTIGFWGISSGRFDETNEAAERVIANPLAAPGEVGAAGTMLAFIGDKNRGLELTANVLTINPRVPGFIRWGHVIKQLVRGDYEGAVAHSRLFTMPNCYVESLLRSTIAVRMGDREGARQWLDRAMKLRPELVSKPKFVLGRVFVINEERDFLLESMRLSGFAATGV